MIPATCQNCATPSPSPAPSLGQDGSFNLGVIFGVLGGMAFVAVVVFVSVPLIRRRTRRRRASTVSSGDLESSAFRARLSLRTPLSGWRMSSRKSPSFRHHQETKPGPDALLPLLPEVSTFTWSDLRSSQNASAESVGAGDMDVADVYSFPTNNATTSHLSLLQDGLHPSVVLGPSVLGGPGGSARTRGSADVSPSANRSLQPYTDSKEPSRADPSRRDERAHEPPAAGSTAVHAIPIARVSLPPAPSASRANFYTPGIDMPLDPLLEHGASKARAGSRPGSLQLPSPPASPPYPPHHASSHPRPQSYAPGHSRSPSQSSGSQADWRFNTSRARPPLANTHSAPATTALPFRPTSTAASPPSWSHPVATNLPLPVSPPRSPPASSNSPVHLTAAFRTSILRSGSQSTGGTTDTGRYPSITTSSPPPIPETEAWSPTPSVRSRSGSVMSERPARAPHGARPRPVELLRNESSRSDGRSGRRASMSAAPTAIPPPSGDDYPGERDPRRAYLRSSVSLTPKVEETDTPRGRSAALSYFDPPEGRPAPQERLAADRTPSRSVSRAPGSDAVRSSDELQARLAAYSLSPSRRSSISQPLPNPHPPSHPPTPRSHQPAFVPKKDSLALKPLPVSALLHSPPHSPPRSTHSREGSLSISSISHGSRSRAGSIASVSIAPSREGSVYEGRSGRHASHRGTRLPPLEPLAPMEFAKFGDYDSDDDHKS